MDPIHQFTITPLIELSVNGNDISFTNASLFMVLAVGLILGFLFWAVRQHLLVPDRWQNSAEISYLFVYRMVLENAGFEARPLVPLVFTLFAFILTCNLLAMLPFGFAVTSHLAVTGALALLVFIVVTVLGLVKQGWHFFSRFAPKGVPVAILPFMIPLEILSYFIRPVSLSVRLFANIMAGHAMMKVFASFIVMMGAAMGMLGYALGLAPFALLVVMTGFEIFVAGIQAYVFALLTVVYIQDAMARH